MEETTTALNGCANPRSNEDRLRKEGEIRAIRKRDPKMFLYHASEILKDEGANIKTRQLAGILFKNTVLNTTKDVEFEGLWYIMTPDERHTLKTSLLEALGSQTIEVIRAAGSCISSIAMLEVPHGEWLEVINLLCNNISHELPNIRHASLLTLGYMCEELAKDELKREQVDYIITAFMESLEINCKDDGIIKETIQGIYHSLKFAEVHFSTGDGGKIMDNIYKVLKHNNTEIRVIAMQCISEIVRMYYDSIPEFMEDITNYTFTLAREDEDDVKTQAIKVWGSIAEEEIFRLSKGYSISNIIDQAHSPLIELLIEVIQILNLGLDDDIEDQEWGPSVAGGWCLELVSKLVGDKVIDLVTNFSAENLNHSKWEQRYSGIIALGAILQGPNKDTLLNTLGPAMEILINLVDDSNPKVKYVINWLFSKIAKSHPELIANEANFITLYRKMIDGLRNQTKVSSNIASIISELADSLLNKGDILVDSSILSECYEELLNELLSFVLQEGLPDSELARVRSSGFAAMYNLLQYAPLDCENICYQFMEHILDMLQKSSEGQIDRKAEELQGFFLCALQCILTNVRRPIDDNQGNNIVDLVIQIFQQRQDVFDEGFLVLSACCIKFPEVCDSKVNDLAPFIIHGLGIPNSAIIRSACGVLSDLCTVVNSSGIIEGYKQYMPMLLDHLKSSDTDRNAKVIIITVIGDTFLVTKDRFFEFLEETLDLLQGASRASLEYDEKTEDAHDDFEYLRQLQSSLVECYTCFIQNIGECEDNLKQTLGQFVEKIFDFLLDSCNPKFVQIGSDDGDMPKFKEVGGLIGDIAATFGSQQNMSQRFNNNDRLNYLVNHLLYANDEEALNLGEFIVAEVKKSLGYY